MSNLIGIFDQELGEKMNQTIESGLTDLNSDITLSVSPTFGSIVATHGASILLACDGANLTNRKLLIVKNTSTIQNVYIGVSLESSIYEQGISLEPQESKKITLADDTIELYARSSGYSVTLELMEA